MSNTSNDDFNFTVINENDDNNGSNGGSGGVHSGEIEDYYAFLNVTPHATADEIRAAYRTLCRRYHPDKHVDPALKAAAEAMFAKLKMVYDVLSDRRRRAIYDAVGPDGIRMDDELRAEPTTGGVEDRTPYRSAHDIRQQYERWQRFKQHSERQRLSLLRQIGPPRGHVTVLIDASDLFQSQPDDHHHMITSTTNGIDDCEGDQEDYSSFGSWFSSLRFPAIGIRSIALTQTIDTPITANDRVAISGNLAVRNGAGVGMIIIGLRHAFSPKCWTELEYGAGGGPLIGVKFFRVIRDDIQALVQSHFHLSPHDGEIKPMLSGRVTRQIGTQLVSVVDCKTTYGGDWSATTAAIHENDRRRVAGSMAFGSRNSFISASYSHKFTANTSAAATGATGAHENDRNIGGRLAAAIVGARGKLGLKLGISGAIFEYGFETSFTRDSMVGAALSIGTATGVSLILKVTRHDAQNYLLPIVLAEDMLPSAIIVGTILPVAAFFAVKRFLVLPYLRRRQNAARSRTEQQSAAAIAERRRAAIAYRSLMRDTYMRSVEHESSIGGLIIERAIYGSANVIDGYADYAQTIPETIDAFDVTVAVQVMVGTPDPIGSSIGSASSSSTTGSGISVANNNNSSIYFTETSKSNLPGFFDVTSAAENEASSGGTIKKLLIRYRYHNAPHQVILDENESGRLPSEQHRVHFL